MRRGARRSGPPRPRSSRGRMSRTTLSSLAASSAATPAASITSYGGEVSGGQVAGHGRVEAQCRGTGGAGPDRSAVDRGRRHAGGQIRGWHGVHGRHGDEDHGTAGRRTRRRRERSCQTGTTRGTTPARRRRRSRVRSPTCRRRPRTSRPRATPTTGTPAAWSCSRTATRPPRSSSWSHAVDVRARSRGWRARRSPAPSSTSGMYEEARENFAWIISINPADDYAQFGLGLAATKLGDLPSRGRAPGARRGDAPGHRLLQHRAARSPRGADRQPPLSRWHRPRRQRAPLCEAVRRCAARPRRRALPRPGAVAARGRGGRGGARGRACASASSRTTPRGAPPRSPST